MTELTRSALLSRALVAGGAIATGGFVAAHIARAADSDEDLAWVRLGVNLEFLKTVFSTRARRTGFFTGADAGSLKRGQDADQAHLDKFVETLTSQGRTSINGNDLDVVFPKTAFNSRNNVAALGSRLAILGVRSYLGASARRGLADPADPVRPGRRQRGRADVLLPGTPRPRDRPGLPLRLRHRPRRGRARGLPTVKGAAHMAAPAPPGSRTGPAGPRRPPRGRRRRHPPNVFAAASLTEVFPKIDPAPHYSFAGSNQLALQIRQGAPADVFASAAPNFTQDLFAQGLVEKPRFLAFNRLAFIVPKSNPAGITSVYDLRRRGIKLVIAAPAVPVGLLHPHRAPQPRPLERAGERGQPGVRREGRGRQGRAGRGGRRLRVRHRRARRRVAAHVDPHPDLRAAQGPLRDRRRHGQHQQGRRERVHQEGHEPAGQADHGPGRVQVPEAQGQKPKPKPKPAAGR